MERLAALEAEVKADADAQRQRKEAAMAKVREQRAQQLAERDQLRTRQAALVSTKKTPEPETEADDDRGLGSALELAVRANKVKQELVRKPKAGEKSLVKAGVASLALGPLGWLYAGSFREAIPASAAWLALAALLMKFPALILMPALLVALPLSAIVGAVYASQYNKTGKRQRLFGKGGKAKQLKAGMRK